VLRHRRAEAERLGAVPWENGSTASANYTYAGPLSRHA